MPGRSMYRLYTVVFIVLPAFSRNVFIAFRTNNICCKKWGAIVTIVVCFFYFVFVNVRLSVVFLSLSPLGEQTLCIALFLQCGEWNASILKVVDEESDNDNGK